MLCSGRQVEFARTPWAALIPTVPCPAPMLLLCSPYVYYIDREVREGPDLLL